MTRRGVFTSTTVTGVQQVHVEPCNEAPQTDRGTLYRLQYGCSAACRCAVDEKECRGAWEYTLMETVRWSYYLVMLSSVLVLVDTLRLSIWGAQCPSSEARSLACDLWLAMDVVLARCMFAGAFMFALCFFILAGWAGTHSLIRSRAWPHANQPSSAR